MSWHLDIIAISKDRAKTAVHDALARQPIGLVGKPDRVAALEQAIAGCIDLMPDLDGDTGIDISSDGGIEHDHGRVLVEISTIRLAK